MWKSVLTNVKILVTFRRKVLLYHNPIICGELEQQLVSVPYGKRDDVADCFAYFIQYMDEHNLMMSDKKLHAKELARRGGYSIRGDIDALIAQMDSRVPDISEIIHSRGLV